MRPPKKPHTIFLNPKENNVNGKGKKEQQQRHSRQYYHSQTIQIKFTLKAGQVINIPLSS